MGGGLTTFGGSVGRGPEPTIGGMTVRTILAGVVLASLLTGCGGSGGKDNDATSHTNGASPSTDIATLWRQYAQCLRKHGAPNYPDAVQRSDGTWGPPPNTSRPPQMAMNACRSSGVNLKNQMRHQQHPVTTAELAKLRQLAQCLRQHGLPTWPDPKPDGSFGGLSPQLRQAIKNPSSATIACRQYMDGPIRTG